ncbi:MAG: hypothetical protein M0R39_17020 [Prolixibacteraceae bacterium]|nr:hypothetical protein [Prolixibacteraceae bacterium]
MKTKKINYKLRFLFATFLFQIITISISAQESIAPPKIPIGMDAYRMWDQWPTQRIGVRAYMRSTYDRTGGNETADASHFLFANEENYNVSLDVKGKGILYFFRTNFWHGSPWHFVVDGRDNLVSESGTNDPLNARKVLKASNFIPESTFPRPLNWTWEITKGADLIILQCLSNNPCELPIPGLTMPQAITFIICTQMKKTYHRKSIHSKSARLPMQMSLIYWTSQAAT